MKKTVVIVFLPVFVLLNALIASAGLDITPSVSVTEEYNDNIFLKRSDREDDFITTLFPRIELKYSPNTALDLSLDYGLRFRFFSRHSEFNDTSIRETQDAEFSARVKPVNRVFVDIGDTYEKVPIDVRERFAEGNLFLNMTERNTLLVSPYSELPITSTVTAKIGYDYKNIWHKDDMLTDYESHSPFITLNKRFSSKINGDLKYRYFAYRLTSEDQEESADYDRHEGSAAFTYHINPNFEVNGEIGEAWYDFAISENKTVTFYNAEAEYRFGSTSIGAGYAFSFDDSPTAGAFKSQGVNVNLKSGSILIITVHPYYSIDEYINSDREDRIAGVSFDMSQKLSEKSNVSINGVLEKQKFLPESEKVDKYSIGSSLEYMVSRSITAAIGYRYNLRDSNVDTGDFHNNIGWLQARVVF